MNQFTSPLRWNFTPIICFLLCFIFFSCSKKSSIEVLAKVNGEIITVADFSESYFQTILYGNQTDSEENRLKYLNQLIDEYLLAQHGIKIGIISKNKLETVENRTRRMKVRDKLLSSEVEKEPIVPDDRDLRRLFTQNSEKVNIHHLFAKTKSEIDSLYRLLQSGKSFNALAFEVFSDSILKFNGGDLGWNQLGDLDPFLEDTAFAMRVNHISHPIESRFGWHILKLEDKIYNPLLTENDFLQKKEDIRKQFIRREQDKRYYRFVNDFMKDKTTVIHNPEWSITVREIQKRFPSSQKVSPIFIQLPFSPEFGNLTPSLTEILGNAMITFPDGDMTVGEFIERIPELPVRYWYGSKKIATELMIRDYFLTQEGTRRGYLKSKDVKSAVLFQKNLRAGALYRQYLLDKITIKPENIDENIVRTEYDSLKNSRFIKNQKLSYSMIVVWDSSNAKSCDRMLTKGMSFSEIILKIGIRKAGVLESGHFLKDRSQVPGLIRQKLMEMKDGQVSNWMTINHRLVRIQRHSIQTNAIRFTEAEKEIRNRLAAQTPYRQIATALETWRKESKITINQEKLRGIWSKDS